MAESTGHESSGRLSSRRHGHGGTKRFERSASECRSKRSLKVRSHRSCSAQPEKRETPPADEAKEKSFLSSVRPSEVEKVLLENSSFPNFFDRVNCPFCLEVQNGKTELVEHLGRSCRTRKAPKSKQLTTFQIMGDGSIKCNVCPDERFGSFEGYFLHLYNDEHVLMCSAMTRSGKQLTDFFYCSCCYLYVPDNATQLQFHLQHKIHKARSGSLTAADLRRQGFVGAYCIFAGKKTFRCLTCPPPHFLFSTPLEMIKHLKTGQHARGMRNSSGFNIYCSFRKTKFSVFETPFHFSSGEHTEKETAAADGRFEACLYCGASFGNLTDLSHHMRVKCEEINRIRQERTAGRKPEDKVEKEKETVKEKPKKKSRCILVKDDVDSVALIRVFKTFGKINSVAKYDDEYLLIEFKNERSIEEISLVHNFIKIDNKKVCIEFLQGDGNVTQTS